MGNRRGKSKRKPRFRDAKQINHAPGSQQNIPVSPIAAKSKFAICRGWIAKSVAFVVVTAGAVASAYQLLGGPPWPTGPSIAPSNERAEPFDITFKVKNASSIFRIKNIKISCVIEHADIGNALHLGSGTLSSSIEGGTVAPLDEKPYQCPFPIKGLPVLNATMKITARYQYFDGGGTFDYESPRFVLWYDRTNQVWVADGPLH